MPHASCCARQDYRTSGASGFRGKRFGFSGFGFGGAFGLA